MRPCALQSSRVGAPSLPARRASAVAAPKTTTTTTTAISATTTKSANKNVSTSADSPSSSSSTEFPSFPSLSSTFAQSQQQKVAVALAAATATASLLLGGPAMAADGGAAAAVASAAPVAADAASASTATSSSSSSSSPSSPSFWKRAPPPAAKKAPFLAKSGARGLLAEEEQRLYNLRLEKEGEVIQELDRARAELLQEENEPGRAGKLCATPFGIDLVGILVFVALTGALVGGVSARTRKAEVERLNDQLRKINLSLRQQARAGTVYAPGLNYAPQPLSPAGRPLSELLMNGGSSGGGGGGDGGVATSAVSSAAAASAATVVAPAAPPAPATTQPSPSSSSSSSSSSSASAPSSPSSSPSKQFDSPSVVVSLDDEEVSAELRACVSALREGKRLLKEKQGPAAMVRFEKALMLAEALGDKVHEKRAVRGLAAAARLNGDRRGAIAHLRRVLALSDEAGDHLGDADACGNIADLYTELGQFERAAEFYDRYISRMATDGPV